MTDIVVRRYGSTAVLTVDRAGSSNAIGPGTMEELDQCLDELDSEVSVLALRGAGDRVFVSGGDLRELAALRSVDQARAMALRMRRILDRIACLPILVVGLLNGHSLGGGAEVAVACDFRIAADDISIGFPQVSLGITPAWGGIERLVSAVGRPRALHLLATGRRVDAQEALRIGLVDELVPRDQFDDRCRHLLDALDGVPRQVLSGLKRTVDSASSGAAPHLEEASVSIFADTWVSDEHWSRVDEMERARAAGRAARQEGP